VRSLRPRQWTKNLLVFAAAGAGGALLRAHVFGRSAIAFVALCMISSAGYLLNDLLDASSDRQHPARSERPIAAGIVSVGAAVATGIVLAAAGLAVAATLGLAFVATVGVYAVLAVSYSVALKRVAVIDIAVVSAGFVVRAVAGSVASGIPLSQWFLILISFGALFVVAGKRYAEYAAMGEHIDRARTPMLEYTAAYLRYVWMLASAVAIAAYCLWAFEQPHAAHHVPWSELSAIPFVLAILRYALVLESGRGGAPEDVLMGDVPFVLLAVAWLVVYACGVYLGR
jgi:decaprenyl-phosphate phosphoribosyltransferase